MKTLNSKTYITQLFSATRNRTRDTTEIHLLVWLFRNSDRHPIWRHSASDNSTPVADLSFGLPNYGIFLNTFLYLVNNKFHTLM